MKRIPSFSSTRFEDAFARSNSSTANAHRSSRAAARSLLNSVKP